MAGTASVPNVFATQAGQVPASQLDGNWNAVTAYINAREVSSGTLSARPATPTAGLWYFANDENGGTLYFGNGSSWIQVAPGLTEAASTTLVAPVTITDATSGGVAHPFLSYQKTGSQTWLTYFQKPANFGGVGGVGSDTLSIGTSNPASGLQLHLIADPGGQRLAVWDPSNPLPNIPHTGILPTMAVYGDVLIGDIVALESNPMTYFIRANSNILHTAVTQLFSAQQAAGTEPDSGPTIILSPMKNGGGAVSDGYIRLEAYGGGTGADANEIQLRQRSASNTLVNRWAVGGAGVFYPKDSDGALDIGSSGNRVRALHLSSNVLISGEAIAQTRIGFTEAGGITAGQTKYTGVWAGSTNEATAFNWQVMACSGTLKGLYVASDTPPGAGQDLKLTLRVNGTSTTLTATISGTNRTANNTTATAAVNKGDTCTLQYTLSSGGTSITSFVGGVMLYPAP